MFISKQESVKHEGAFCSLYRPLASRGLSPPFTASPVVVVVNSDAAAARPAIRHGWLRLLLPHGRRLPVPESRRRQIQARQPHPRTGAAPGRRWGIVVPLAVEGGGSEQVRRSFRGSRAAGHSVG